jgi:CPA1 family monovalent cation:H+ antiporter
METSGIHSVEVIALLLAMFVALLASFAKRLNIPYPIVLVLGGLALSFMPGLPQVGLEPDLIFLVVLPPLVFGAAYALSWRDFRYNLVSILMLAFGLVAFTVVGAAAGARAVLPGFDWRTGMVLGAIVSTTDPIAATSVFQRLRLPKRIIDLVEAESLVNDGSGLVALQFATALVVSQHTPSLLEGAGRLAYLVLAAVPIGLAVGFVAQFVLARINDATIEITVSLVVPFVAYLAADALGTSGVLSTIAAGLYVGNQSSRTFSRDARLTGAAVWETLTFILNGFVFILIGLQLPRIATGVEGARLVVAAIAFSGLLIVLRLVWMFPGAYAANAIRRRFLKHDDPVPSRRAIFLVGYTGMRGVLSLAAALSLPRALADGSPFPGRDAMVFVTFCVILVTLVGQGLALTPLIKKLGLVPDDSMRREEERARRIMVTEAVIFLERNRGADVPEAAEAYDELIRRERGRLDVARAADATSPAKQTRIEQLARTVRNEQRKTLGRLRDAGEIGDEAMRKLERELDLLDAL